MPFKNGTKLCICEICNCGRHRCPHHPVQRGPLGQCALSEYTNQYHPHKMEPVESCKPKAQAVLSGEPLSDKTTHRIDYVPLPLDRQLVRKQADYKPPAGDFDGTTMYQKEYTEKHIPRQAAIKREARRAVPAKFVGEPTYKTDYKNWDLPERERAHAPQEWRPAEVPFEGVPTYTTDYVAHKMRPVTSCKPNLAVKSDSAPFEGLTDYRQSYVPHPLERRQEKEKAEYYRPQVPFEGMTTFQRDYTPKEGGRVMSCKPSAQMFQSGAPLASETTFRNDYKPWELERPQLHHADPYKAPEGDMYLGTTYGRDFMPHGMAKREPIRQLNRGRVSSAPFQGTTDYRDNYKLWGVGRREAAGPHQEYVAPSVPFEGQSTHQAHYIQHPLEGRKSFKPDGSRAANDAPFEGETIYRTEYTPKKVMPCPAAVLETGNSEYIYREQDPTGHKFYEPVTEASARRFASAKSHRVPLAAH